MPPAIASLTTRLFDAAGAGRAARIGVPVALHLAALAILLATESTLVSRAAYLLTGDLASTLNHMVRIDRELSVVPRDEVGKKLLAHGPARDLIFYALSPATATLRRSVGTG